MDAHLIGDYKMKKRMTYDERKALKEQGRKLPKMSEHLRDDFRQMVRANLAKQ
jgi:hypothetical protein